MKRAARRKAEQMTWENYRSCVSQAVSPLAGGGRLSSKPMIEPPQRVRGVKPRLAFVVSHPIQYYVPLYQQLARHDDLEIRVFYTWHDGSQAAWDSGFSSRSPGTCRFGEGYRVRGGAQHGKRPWDAPLLGDTESSTCSSGCWPGGLMRCTSPATPLPAIYGYCGPCIGRRIPVLFRGDSHLLSAGTGLEAAV